MASVRRSSSSETVRVDGLREVQAELRAVDAKAPRQMRIANLEAAEVIARPAQARARSLGGVQAHIAPSIRATAEQRAAKVSLGGAKYPMAFGANFGANHDVARPSNRGGTGTVLGWNQFPPPRKPDYIVYTTIIAEKSAFVAVFDRNIAKLTRQAFPDR